MLDLTTRTSTKKLYEIKMPDGQILKLKMPTQRLLMKLMDMQNYLNDPMAVVGLFNQLLTSILNLNTQGIVYTEEQVIDMIDLETAILVIQDYLQETTKTLGE